jgi:hypothetical protein
LIDARVDGAVDDDVGLESTHATDDRVNAGDVTFATGQSAALTPGKQEWLDQGTPQHSTGAEDQQPFVAKITWQGHITALVRTPTRTQSISASQ